MISDSKIKIKNRVRKGKQFIYICLDCGAEVEPRHWRYCISCGDKRKREAVARRTKIRYWKIRELKTCSICGAILPRWHLKYCEDCGERMKRENYIKALNGGYWKERYAQTKLLRTDAQDSIKRVFEA